MLLAAATDSSAAHAWDACGTVTVSIVLQQCNSDDAGQLLSDSVCVSRAQMDGLSAHLVRLLGTLDSSGSLLACSILSQCLAGTHS